VNRLEHDWFPAPLPEGVSVGEGSWVHSSYGFRHCRSRVAEPVRIGRNTGVYAWSSFELGPEGRVSIGDECTITYLVVCTNGAVEIGNRVMTSFQVAIADGPFAVPGRGGGAGGTIRLHDNVWVGARAVLLPGAEIGPDSVVAARTVVDFEVPPGVLVAGNPARIVRSLRS
jgi:acetyltransferase-like isoleucine patch superfamily enzyme